MSKRRVVGSHTRAVHSALGLPPPTSPLLSTGLTSLDSSTQTSPYPPIVIGRVEKIRKLGKRKAYGIRRCMGTIKETWEVKAEDSVSLSLPIKRSQILNGRTTVGPIRYIPLELLTSPPSSPSLQPCSSKNAKNLVKGNVGGHSKLISYTRKRSRTASSLSSTAVQVTDVEGNLRLMYQKEKAVSRSTGEGGEKEGISSKEENENDEAEVEGDRWEEGGEEDYTKDYYASEGEEEEGGDNGKEATF